MANNAEIPGYFSDEAELVGGIVPQLNVERVTLQNSGSDNTAIIRLSVLEKIRTFMRDPYQQGHAQGGPQHAVNIGSWYNISDYGSYFNIYAIQISHRNQSTQDDSVRRIMKTLEHRTRRLSNLSSSESIRISILDKFAQLSEDAANRNQSFSWARVDQISLKDEILSISRHSNNDHLDRVEYELSIAFPTQHESLDFLFFIHFDVFAWSRDNLDGIDVGNFQEYIHGIGGQMQHVRALRENTTPQFMQVMVDEHGIPWLGDFHRVGVELFTGASSADVALEPPRPLKVITVSNGMVVDNRFGDIGRAMYYGDLQYINDPDVLESVATGTHSNQSLKDLVSGFGVDVSTGYEQQYRAVTKVFSDFKNRRTKQYAQLISREIRGQSPLLFNLDFYDDSSDYLISNDGQRIRDNMSDQLSGSPLQSTAQVRSNVEVSEGREGQVNLIFSIDMSDFLSKKSVLANYFPLFGVQINNQQGPFREFLDVFPEPLRGDYATLKDAFVERIEVLSVKVFRHTLGGHRDDRVPPVLVAHATRNAATGRMHASPGSTRGSISEVLLQFKETFDLNRQRGRYTPERSFAVTDWDISKRSGGKYFYQLEMEIQDPIFSHFKSEFKSLVAVKTALSNLYSYLNQTFYLIPAQIEYDPLRGMKEESDWFVSADVEDSEGKRVGFVRTDGTDNYDADMIQALAEGRDGLPTFSERLLDYGEVSLVQNIAGSSQIGGTGLMQDYDMDTIFGFLENILIRNFKFMLYEPAAGDDADIDREFIDFTGRLVEVIESARPRNGRSSVLALSNVISLVEDLILHYRDIFGFSDGHSSLEGQNLASCGRNKIMSVLKYSKVLHGNVFDADKISSFRSLYIDVPQVFDETLVPVISQAQLRDFIIEKQLPKYHRAIRESDHVNQEDIEPFFVHYSPYLYTWRIKKNRTSILEQQRFDPDLLLVEYDKDSLNPALSARIERYLNYAFDKVASQLRENGFSSMKSTNSTYAPRLSQPGGAYLAFDEPPVDDPARAQEIEGQIRAFNERVKNHAALNHSENVNLANIMFFHRDNPIARWDNIVYHDDVPEDAPDAPQFGEQEERRLREMADLVLPPNGLEDPLNQEAVFDQLIFSKSISLRAPLLNLMNDVVSDSYVNQVYGASTESRTDQRSGPILTRLINKYQADQHRASLPVQVRLALEDRERSRYAGGLFEDMVGVEGIIEPYPTLSRFSVGPLVELQIKQNLESGYESWRTISGDFLNELRPGFSYLCRLVYYQNRDYGFYDTFVKRGTQIVDRVFLINFEGGVDYSVNRSMFQPAEGSDEGVLISHDSPGAEDFSGDHYQPTASALSVGSTTTYAAEPASVGFFVDTAYSSSLVGSSGLYTGGAPITWGMSSDSFAIGYTGMEYGDSATIHTTGWVESVIEETSEGLLTFYGGRETSDSYLTIASASTESTQPSSSKSTPSETEIEAMKKVEETLNKGRRTCKQKSETSSELAV